VSGDKVYYGTVSSGNANCVNPNLTTELAKIVLHNTTRGEEALIIDTGTDGGGNFIQVSSSGDVSAWVATNAITARSQTNTTNIGSSFFFDLSITSTEVPALTVSLLIAASFRDSGAIDERVVTHPYEANNSAARQFALSTSTAQRTDMLLTVPITNRRFCFLWTASGSGTGFPRPVVRQVTVATP
jgi:hypothetical protein